MGLFKPIWTYVDALVHPSAHGDALTIALHRAFIAPRLMGSAVALMALPAYLAARGVPSVLEIGAFAWLVVPIITAYFLSRTGRYESAHVFSSLALTGLIATVAYYTGGITSFAAPWLVIVPLEAALSASRRVVTMASMLALGAAATLVVCGVYGLLPALPPEHDDVALAAVGIISAVLYATALALGAEALARTGAGLFQAEESRYQLLARNMTDAITRHRPNGTVLFASPAVEPLFGTKVGDLTGHGLFDRVHVADRPAYLTALADAAAYGEECSVEFRVRQDFVDAAGGRSSRFVWVEMRCRPLDRAAGETEAAPSEVVAVLRDITDRKAQEQALHDARAEAERGNAAKSRFLATMSHELRTPLNVIIGFSEMLTNERDMQVDAARRVEYARLINESGNHLLSVVNGILDMSKIETGEFDIRPEPFAPAPVISGCCELLALKAKNAGVELKANVPPSLPEIIGDKQALKQILINLLSNAIKFTGRGGQVKVAATTEPATLVISVEDNGVGIGEDDLPYVGEPFFQARGSYDRRHDGTGLGLSIVKGLVALHSGELIVRSRPSAGTCMTVRLPFDCEAARRSGPSPSVIRHIVEGGAIPDIGGASFDLPAREHAVKKRA